MKKFFMIYFSKKRKCISIKMYKIKSHNQQCLIKYKHPIAQQRQFYENSKTIMQKYDENFLAEIEKEKITRYNNKKWKQQTKIEKTSKTYQIRQAELNLLSKFQYQQDQEDIHYKKITYKSIEQNENNYQELEQKQQFRTQKHMSSNIQDKKQIVNKIIKLYQEFFTVQKSLTKAEQIMHIYKKKLCQQGILIPTLFCWLNDWLHKQFVIFLKQEISQFTNRRNVERNKIRIHSKKDNQKNNNQKQQNNLKIFNKKSDIPKVQCEKSNQKQIISLNSQKSKEDLFQKISLIKKKSLKRQEFQIQTQQRQPKNISGPKQLPFLTIQPSQQKQSRQLGKNRNLTINHYELSNLLPLKTQSDNKSIQTVKKQPQQPDEQYDNFPINRQILIGAYYDKFYTLYKNLQSALPELDIQFIKKIKRNDRKKQIKKRINQITRILVKSQIQIKNSSQKYEIDYFQRKKKNKKLRKNKISKSQPIKEFASYLLHNQNKISKELNKNQTSTEINNIINFNSNNIKRSRLIQPDKKSLPGSLNKLPSNEEQSPAFKKYNPSKRQQRQLAPVNVPLKFQLNLPLIPQKQRNSSNRMKQSSKVVLIQSGRYRLIQSQKNEQNVFSIRKNKTHNVSADYSSLQILNSQSQDSPYSLKHKQKPREHSVSILQRISHQTDKKRFLQRKKDSNSQLLDKILYHSISTDQPQIKEPSFIKKERNRRLRKKNQQIQNSLKKLIQNMNMQDQPQITGWEGQSSPLII